MCAHCRLDERWLAWELRLFSLQSRALAAGAAVSAEDALRQATLNPIVLRRGALLGCNYHERTLESLRMVRKRMQHFSRCQRCVRAA